MIEVVVVRSLQTNSIYYLAPNSLDLKKEDDVVFETDNGLLLGKVCKEIYQEKKKNLVLPLSKVLRKAEKIMINSKKI